MDCYRFMVNILNNKKYTKATSSPQTYQSMVDLANLQLLWRLWDQGKSVLPVMKPRSAAYSTVADMFLQMIFRDHSGDIQGLADNHEQYATIRHIL